jgi:hypothetical protein
MEEFLRAAGFKNLTYTETVADYSIIAAHKPAG